MKENNKKKASTSSALFGLEEKIISQGTALLGKKGIEPQQLREAFASLLKSYQKLSRQSIRLNRISDRNQLALRNSEQTLNKTLAELQRHQQKLALDQSMVEEILVKMHTGRTFIEDNLRHLLIPIDRASGDLLFSSIRPDGVRHILLGDMTGHGLPAAIVGPEVSDVFYTMTLKGFAPGVILAEINKRLRGRLPTGIYLAANLLAWDESSRQLSIWNGGLPDTLIFRQGKEIEEIPSNGLPLGIVDNSSQNWTRPRLTLEPGDRVVLHSDGIIEGRNLEGEMFGMERFKKSLLKIYDQNSPLETVVEVLKEFIDDPEGIDDDITMVELTC
jgi:two-component system, HptB-dependent secretion and biofilm response regulator